MRRWVVLALVFAGILISYLDRGNLSLAAVPVMREFGYSSVQVGVLLSCFFWTYGLLQVPSGIAIDRFGIKRIYASAFFVWSLASASVGLSRGFSTFLAARLLLGVAESVAPIASLSYIRQNFTAKDQGLPMGIYIAGTTLGPAVGTLLGTNILNSLGWRSLFITTGLGALLWLVPWLLLVPDAGAPVQLETKSKPVSRELLSTLGQPGALMMSAFVFLYSYYWYFVLTWVPSYLVLVHKFNTLEMGSVLSVPLFGMAICAVAGGAAADFLIRCTNQGIRVRIWFMCVGMIGCGSILLLTAVSDRRFVMPILFVSACSAGIGNTNYWSLAQILSPAEMVGRSIGYLNTLAQAAGATAPLLTGFLLGHSQRFGVALMVAGICPLAAALCAGAVGAGRLEVFRERFAAIHSGSAS